MVPMWVDKLWEIYTSGKQLNNTCRLILKYLDKEDYDLAYSEFYTDGDKIPRYTKWGKEFVKQLHINLGCRLHRVKNCNHQFCKYVLQEKK